MCVCVCVCVSFLVVFFFCTVEIDSCFLLRLLNIDIWAKTKNNYSSVRLLGWDKTEGSNFVFVQTIKQGQGAVNIDWVARTGHESMIQVSILACLPCEDTRDER